MSNTVLESVLDFFDAGDPEQVKARGESLKYDRTEEQNDLFSVLETDEGKRLIWRILSHTKPMSMSYVPGGLVEDMYFNEGRKSVGTWLISELNNADPRIYLQLQEFHLDD